MSDPAAPSVADVRRPRRRSGKLIVGGILVACVLAVVSIIVFRAATGPDPIAARVPAESSAYLQITLQPSLSQKRAVGALVDRLPGGRDAAETEIQDMLGSQLPGFDLAALRFADWAGDQVALVRWRRGEDAEALILVAHAKDLTVAEQVVADVGSPLSAVLDTGFVYVTRGTAETLEAFRAAAHAHPLSRDRGFRNARGRVGGDGILLARIDLAAVGAGLGSEDLGSVVIGGQVVDGGVRFTAAEERPFIQEPLPSPKPLTIAPELAEHAHGVFGIVDPAAALRALASLARRGSLEEAAQRIGLDLEEDLFSWLRGEAAVRVVNFGDNEHHATVVVQSSDAQAMRDLVGTVRALLAFSPPEGVSVEGSDPDRFTVHVGRFDAQVSIVDARLTIEIASRGATTSNEDADAIAGLPEGPISFAGVVDVAVLIEEASAGMLFGGDGPFGRYGDAIDRIGFEATSDETGPLLSVTFFVD